MTRTSCQRQCCSPSSLCSPPGVSLYQFNTDCYSEATTRYCGVYANTPPSFQLFTDHMIGVWVGLAMRGPFNGRSWVHLLVNPCVFGTTHTSRCQLSMYVHCMVFCRAGRCLEEPRSSGALDWGDGQASVQVSHHHRAILFWTRPRRQLDSSRLASSSSS